MSEFISNLPTLSICKGMFFIDYTDFSRQVDLASSNFLVKQVYSNLVATMNKTHKVTKRNPLTIFKSDKRNYSGNQPTLRISDTIVISVRSSKDLFSRTPLVITRPKLRPTGKSVLVADVLTKYVPGHGEGVVVNLVPRIEDEYGTH